MPSSKHTNPTYDPYDDSKDWPPRAGSSELYGDKHDKKVALQRGRSVCVPFVRKPEEKHTNCFPAR